MAARLDPIDDGPPLHVDDGIVLIGRGPECDVVVASRKVSRQHCCIVHVGDHLVVRDLGSTNGIRVNGEPVSEGTLDCGDELTIGDREYRVAALFDGQHPTPMPPAPPSASRESPACDNTLLDASPAPAPDSP